jgi:hypothetical protein
MTNGGNVNQIAQTPNAQALLLANRIEVLADGLFADVRGQNPNYAATPEAINELYVRLGELRPVIDQLLEGPADNRWPNVPTAGSNGGGWEAFLFGVLVGVIGAAVLSNAQL